MSAADPRALLDPEFSSLLDVTLFEKLDLEIVKQHRVSQPGLGSTDKVERVDLEIDGRPPVRVRIHRARESHGHSPAMLSIHGGGYIVGSYDMDDGLFEEWSPRLGVVGVSVDYRLAPETPFPGPLDDCHAALQWIHANAQSLGIDRDRVGVWGPSAGGGLAAALAQRVRDEGTTPLSFVLLEAPMLDDRRVTVSSRQEGLVVWSREANEFGWKCYLGAHFGSLDMPPYAVPARESNLAGLPPTFISVGGADGFRDEDVDYALRLSQAAVSTELHVYPGAPHGYQMFVDSRAARQGRRDATDWLARVIAGH
jgi:acetyl esterase/lipase